MNMMDTTHTQGHKSADRSIMLLGVTKAVLALLVLSYLTVTSDACSCAYEHPQNTYCKADYVIKVRIVGSHMIYAQTEGKVKPAKNEKNAPATKSEPDKGYEIPEVASLTEEGTLENSVEGTLENPIEGSEIPEPMEPKVKPGESWEEEEVTTQPPYHIIPPIYQSYKVNINKIFKGEDLIGNLNDTRHILTNAYDSLCGKTRLSNGTRYLIMGYIWRGSMWVSLCDHVQNWKSLTVRMRKNIHYNYDRNCDCKVENCKTKNCHRQRKNSTCFWETKANHEECYINHAYCQLRSQNACKWSRNSATVECIQNSEKQKNNTVETMVLP